MRLPDQLADQLAQLNASSVSRMDAPGVVLMAELADGWEQDRKAKSEAKNMELGERVRLAVRRFRDGGGTGGTEVDYRTLRLICHGCTQCFGPGEEALLSELPLMERLLCSVSGYSHRARAFRRLYLSLLSAYFSADRSAAWFAAAEPGNEALRHYLAQVRTALLEVDPPVQRLTALSQHPSVLAQDATRIFAKTWLAGDDATLQTAVSRLEIPGSSWFVTQTLASALETLGGLTDSDYLAVLPRLLTAAGDPRYQTVRDDIYAAAVMRYAAMQSRPIHADLREALVGAWKNPWMARNDGAWGRVSDEARKMVGGWLKLELIHQFFDVLSEDGRQDRRRFEFWSKYYDKMDDVYFALGSDAYWSRRPDLVKLREALDGRLLQLTNAPPKTSAFVMCMGDLVVVEFSQQSNAVHTFPRRELRITPESVSIGMHSLKIASGDARWIHRGAWEDDFRRRLSNEPPPMRPHPVTRETRAAFMQTPPTWGQTPSQQASRRDDAQIMTFAQMNGIRVIVPQGVV